MKASRYARTEFHNRDGRTVLVVADDPDILILAKAILAGKGHRVLVADHYQDAMRLLGFKSLDVHSVVIRAGMNGCEQVHMRALGRGASPRFFGAFIEEGIIQMRGLERAAAAANSGSAAR